MQNTVIDGGYCIGCGACASLPGSPYRMVWNDAGLLEAAPENDVDESRAPVAAVCPFSEASIDENRLASDLFSETQTVHPAVGRYLRCYVGTVADQRVRASASSGGLGRHIAASLLIHNLVDQVLHVVPRPQHDTERALFTYRATSDPDQVLAGAKSAYYPVTLSDVCDSLVRSDTRLAVVALPCFVKALRLMARTDRCVARNLKYTIGLFCGGLRSTRYAEMIAWQMGVHPDELTGIDFREKYVDRPANHKGHRALALSGHSRLGSSKDLFGTDYGMGFFKPKACDFCDDVTAELADVSVGDAWLPDQIQDPRGTSALVVRSPIIGDLIERHRVDGALLLDEVSAEAIATSQASGIRHRREGTRYRSEKCARIGVWSPPKRDFGHSSVPARRRAIYDMREKIRVESSAAFSAALHFGDYHHFQRQMQPLIRRYRRAARPLLVRVFGRFRGLVARLLRG